MSKRTEDLEKQIIALREELPAIEKQQRSAVMRLDLANATKHTQHIESIKNKIARREQWLKDLRV